MILMFAFYYRDIALPSLILLNTSHDFMSKLWLVSPYAKKFKIGVRDWRSLSLLVRSVSWSGLSEKDSFQHLLLTNHASDSWLLLAVTTTCMLDMPFKSELNKQSNQSKLGDAVSVTICVIVTPVSPTVGSSAGKMPASAFDYSLPNSCGFPEDVGTPLSIQSRRHSACNPVGL